MTIRGWVRRLGRRLVSGPTPTPTNQLQREAGIITMGRHSYAQPTVHYYAGDTAKVRIGSFTSIGADVELMPGGNHTIDTVTTYPFRIRWGLPGAFTDGQPWSKGDILIGNDVWIGRGARILGGVTIGSGAVVGAYSVVVRDIEPFSIVAGNPALHRRFRFDEPTREALMRIAWWDWSDEVLAERVDEICSRDIQSFIRRYNLPA